MFLSETHLPQLIEPEAYFDPGWYQKEQSHVLKPAWWAVATLDDFPREGDFLTFDHVDGPVILWKKGGEIRAFRNVCAHRFAKLTGKARGHCDCLSCDYHGWEYDEAGTTKRIPDAASFRPLEKGRLGLTALRVAVVGCIVFLSFDDHGMPIREWLGDEWQRITDRFGSRARTLWRADIDVPVNWKLVVENNIESYHIGSVHRETLGSFPVESLCEHQFTDLCSRFTGPGLGSTWAACRLAVARQIRASIDASYSHSLVYPAFTWLCVDVVSGFQSIVPTGPTSCRMSVRFGAIQAETVSPVMDLAARVCVAGELKFWKRVIHEDLALLPQVQAGIESPRRPGSGLISRREERIVHFQRWILDCLDSTNRSCTGPDSTWGNQPQQVSSGSIVRETTRR